MREKKCKPVEKRKKSKLFANINNEIELSGASVNLVAETTYNQSVFDNIQFYIGVNLENEVKGSFDKMALIMMAGIQYSIPSFVDLDFAVDNQFNPQFCISKEIVISPRVSLSGTFEYQIDLREISKNEEETIFGSEQVWKLGFSFMLTENFFLIGVYDNQLGTNGGLSIRF